VGGGNTSNLIDAGDCNRWEDNQADANTRLASMDAVHNIGNATGTLTITAGATGSVKLITLTGNTTFTFSSVTSGVVFSLELMITQDATGSRVVTWPASVKWPNGAPPTLTTTGGSLDRLVFVTVNGGTAWYGDLVGKAYA
jgi:hypothetical protein